jgi:hypothetical protein
MKTLKTSFRLNGLPYTLLKRNDVVALYGIGGTYSDEILHYEVDVIYLRNDKYGEREHIAKNDDFGRDRSRCFAREDLALKYYDELTIDLLIERIQSQGVSKPIAGGQDNDKVISEYQFEEICELCY